MNKRNCARSLIATRLLCAILTQSVVRRQSTALHRWRMDARLSTAARYCKDIANQMREQVLLVQQVLRGETHDNIKKVPNGNDNINGDTVECPGPAMEDIVLPSESPSPRDAMHPRDALKAVLDGIRAKRPVMADSIEEYVKSMVASSGNKTINGTGIAVASSFNRGPPTMVFRNAQAPPPPFSIATSTPPSGCLTAPSGLTNPSPTFSAPGRTAFAASGSTSITSPLEKAAVRAASLTRSWQPALRTSRGHITSSTNGASCTTTQEVGAGSVRDTTGDAAAVREKKPGILAPRLALKEKGKVDAPPPKINFRVGGQRAKTMSVCVNVEEIEPDGLLNGRANGAALSKSHADLKGVSDPPIGIWSPVHNRARGSLDNAARKFDNPPLLRGLGDLRSPRNTTLLGLAQSAAQDKRRGSDGGPKTDEKKGASRPFHAKDGADDTKREAPYRNATYPVKDARSKHLKPKTEGQTKPITPVCRTPVSRELRLFSVSPLSRGVLQQPEMLRTPKMLGSKHRWTPPVGLQKHIKAQTRSASCDRPEDARTLGLRQPTLNSPVRRLRVGDDLIGNLSGTNAQKRSHSASVVLHSPGSLPLRSPRLFPGLRVPFLSAQLS
eukprot:GEMP01013299.1.p1 GENE.GEMP01013299.1~~GEMP01013299.1.p1  ORF type:complete len:612 (+),score=141.07 GEMP01013299.1:57-1892(+)